MMNEGGFMLLVHTHTHTSPPRSLCKFGQAPHFLPVEHALVTADHRLGDLSLSFDGYAFERKRIGRSCADGASPARAEIAAQIYAILGF